MSPGTGASARLFVALDVPGAAEALELARRVGGAYSYKVGLELFAAAGHDVIPRLERARLFVDLKLHDIPETVARAVGAVAGLGADYVTVHALGGRRMLRAAAEAARRASDARGSRLTVLAVTILTSHDDADLAEVGLGPATEAVPRLAELAASCGIDGFVCSPLEAASVRRAVGPSAFVVTPGIRPRPPAGADDQRRTATARQAIGDGASAVVVGRPIRDAADPAAAAADIAREIADAEAARG